MTKLMIKVVRIRDTKAPKSESISLNGGTKSILRNSEPILPSKNSPIEAPINIVSNARTTF